MIAKNPAWTVRQARFAAGRCPHDGEVCRGRALDQVCGPEEALNGDIYCAREGHLHEAVDHPPHYGGEDNAYEAIKVIEAWDLGFCLGNAVKYISRAGKKPGTDRLTDLRKARWYLDREIQQCE